MKRIIVTENDLMEEAFGAYLDRIEYDAAECALFDVVRGAFLAGWRAAGGELPLPQPIVSAFPGRQRGK